MSLNKVFNIRLIRRCDGEEDCEGEEDELECGEIESQRNAKCDTNENFIRCPRSRKCILKDWLCDGDDDCGDLSDETNCGKFNISKLCSLAYRRRRNSSRNFDPQ